MLLLKGRDWCYLQCNTASPFHFLAVSCFSDQRSKLFACILVVHRLTCYLIGPCGRSVILTTSLLGSKEKSDLFFLLSISDRLG